jgi:hypothetical protein
LRRMLQQLAPRLRRVLHVLLHLRAQPQHIRRRTPLARRLPLRSLRQLRQRLRLQLPLHDLALRLRHPRRVPAYRCDLQQHREARLQEHVLRQHRLGLHGLPAHPQLCNVIRVPARLLQAPGKRVLVRRKACARLVEHRNNIVQAARRRVVLVVRQGSVRVDRLRGSRNVRAAVADRVVATIKDPSERSVPAREFRRPNQGSRSTRANRQHADGR